MSVCGVCVAPNVTGGPISTLSAPTDGDAGVPERSRTQDPRAEPRMGCSARRAEPRALGEVHERGSWSSTSKRSRPGTARFPPGFARGERAPLVIDCWRTAPDLLTFPRVSCHLGISREARSGSTRQRIIHSFSFRRSALIRDAVPDANPFRRARQTPLGVAWCCDLA